MSGGNAGGAAAGLATNGAFAGIGNVIGQLSQAVTALNGGITDYVRGAAQTLAGRSLMGTDPAAKLGATLPGMVGPIFEPMAKATGSFGDAMTGITGAMTGFLAPLEQAGSSMGRFVEAFSPSMMLPFQQAMRDISAVIGSALAPAFSVLTGVIKEVGATLAPVFAKMGEIITPLAQALGGIVTTVVGSLAKAFMALSPLIEAAVSFMIPLVQGVASLGEAVAIVATAMFRTMSDGLSGHKDGIRTFAEGLQKMLEHLAKGILLVTASIAKWVGSNSFLDNMIKGMKPDEGRRDITGAAAVQGARYNSFSEFGRQMALAASMATGGGTAKKKDTGEWLEETLAEVKALRSNQKTIGEVLDTWGNGFARILARSIVEASLEAASASARGARAFATGQAGGVANTIEKLVDEAARRLKLRGLDIEDG